MKIKSKKIRTESFFKFVKQQISSGKIEIAVPPSYGVKKGKKLIKMSIIKKEVDYYIL